MFIYVIRNNKVANKCYVGKTMRSLERRWKEHVGA
jgi:hypothetical protein